MNNVAAIAAAEAASTEKNAESAQEKRLRRMQRHTKVESAHEFEADETSATERKSAVLTQGLESEEKRGIETRSLVSTRYLRINILLPIYGSLIF